MNYKKPNYETPDMKVLEMHTEGVMCQSFGDEGEAGVRILTDEYGEGL